MKTKSFFAILALSAMLVATPAFAQRGGGSRGGGGSVSSSSSRSGGSYSGSSSRSGGSYSGSSSRSSSSYSGSSSRSNNSYSTPSSRSTSRSNSGSYSAPSSRQGSTSYRSSDRSNSAVRNSGTYSSPSSRRASSERGEVSTRGGSRSTVGAPSSRTPGRSFDRSKGDGVRHSSPSGTPSRVEGNGRPSGTPPHNYARPGAPGGHMPPSHRPMHPAPYFHHPYHHHMIHMHPIFWHPVPPRPIFWPGFWLYCNSYWYDYHVTDVVVVNRYVKDTYNVDMVSYVISGDIMYAIVNDTDGNTYLQVFDQNDKLLAEQEISRKYIKTELDRENGGCWIFKKRDKDPMLFLYTNGELLIYEAD